MRPFDTRALPAERPQPGQASSTLGGIGPRLVEGMELSGNYNFALGGQVTPVIIVEDVRGRGPDYIGRRFFASVTSAIIGASTLGLKFNGAAVIDRMEATNSVSDQLIVRLKGWNQADPFAMGTAASLWTDAKDQSDLAPITSGVTPAGSTGFAFAVSRVSSSLRWQSEGELFLRSGNAVLFEFAAAGQASAAIWGRIVETA